MGCAAASLCRWRCRRVADDRQRHHPGPPLCGWRKRRPSTGSWLSARWLLDQDPLMHQRPWPDVDAGRGARQCRLCRPDGRARQRSGVPLGDRGCDDDASRHDVRNHGGQPEIPATRNRRIQHTVERPFYVLRNRIERCINRLTNSQHVATRHDYIAGSFLGFVQLAAIRLWIDFVHAAWKKSSGHVCGPRIAGSSTNWLPASAASCLPNTAPGAYPPGRSHRHRAASPPRQRP